MNGIGTGWDDGELSPSTFMELRHAATDRLTLVVVPERRLLAIDGRGEPGAADFQHATTVLRAAAVVLRARLARSRLSVDRVGIFECAWWADPNGPAAGLGEWSFRDRSAWSWRQLIAIPARATERDAGEAIEEARRQAGRASALVRVIRLAEGRCVQLLHVGGLRTEPTSLARLFEAVAATELRPRGPIHELWVADERDVAPGRARAILRIGVDGPTGRAGGEPAFPGAFPH